jgi:predicted dinucleotide-binding enzyme
MKIAIFGPGRIGGNLARQLLKAGHEVTLTFSRDPQRLQARANVLGQGIRAAPPAQALQWADAVVLSVPWGAIDDVIRAVGNFADKVVIDTTNQFGPLGVIQLPGNISAAEYNARRLPRARLAKAFNTLTSGYQAEVGDGKHRPTALFYACQDETAKAVCEQLVADVGFEPVFLGGWDVVSLMEAPRRSGAVYGEAYRPDDARYIAAQAGHNMTEASALADERKKPE